MKEINYKSMRESATRPLREPLPLALAETLQLHFPQAAQGAAEWKRQVAVCIKLIQGHLGLDE